MSVLPLPTPDRRVVRCANPRCNRILRRPPINGLGPECAKAAGFEAPTTARLRVARQDGPTLFDQHNEGDTMTEFTTIDGPEPKTYTADEHRACGERWLREAESNLNGRRPNAADATAAASIAAAHFAAANVLNVEHLRDITRAALGESRGADQAAR